MRADSAVEPTKSENMTVTWRRSARSSGCALGVLDAVAASTGGASPLASLRRAAMVSAREAFHHYGRFAAARLSLVVATSDGAGRFFTAFDAPGHAAALAPSDAPNLPPRASRRAVFARTCDVRR